MQQEQESISINLAAGAVHALTIRIERDLLLQADTGDAI
jgi:hypothetical protein